MDKIPKNVLLNVILVNENVRPAMMIQPKDYYEVFIYIYKYY